MANRIATSAEIKLIDTWAAANPTHGSMASVDLGWEAALTDHADWIAMNHMTDNEDGEAVLTLTYRASVLDASAGTFNTTDVVKTFTIDDSLVPDAEEEEEEEE